MGIDFKDFRKKERVRIAAEFNFNAISLIILGACIHPAHPLITGLRKTLSLRKPFSRTCASLVIDTVFAHRLHSGMRIFINYQT